MPKMPNVYRLDMSKIQVLIMFFGLRTLEQLDSLHDKRISHVFKNCAMVLNSITQ